MISTERKKHVNSIRDFDFIDLVDEAQMPTVSIFVDMYNLKSVLGQDDLSRLLSDGDLSYGLIEFGNKIGKLNKIFVASDSTKDYTSKIWQRKDIEPCRPIVLNQTNVLVALEVAKTLLDSPTDIFVFVSADSTYADVAKFLIERGKIVIVISPKGSKVNYIRNFCQYTFTLNDVVSLSDDLSVDEYDMTDFIRLVKSNMDYLEFVGVQYLINDQMPSKLSIENTKTCQQIFHRAKEEEIIVIGQKDNVDPKRKPVTSCELNMEHDLVRAVLGLDDEEEEELSL